MTAVLSTTVRVILVTWRQTLGPLIVGAAPHHLLSAGAEAADLFLHTFGRDPNKPHLQEVGRCLESTRLAGGLVHLLPGGVADFFDLLG